MKISILKRTVTTPKSGIVVIKYETSPCLKQGYRLVGALVEVIITQGQHQCRISGGVRLSGINMGGPRVGATEAHADALSFEALGRIEALIEACGGSL